MDQREVIDQMLLAGLECPPTPLRTDGKVVRFGRKRNGWYSLRELRTQGGRWVVVGAFGDWRQGINQKVEVDWAGIGEAERTELRERQAAQEAARRHEREAEARQAAMSARELWASGATHGESAYLARKGVAGECCRYLPDGSILVPLLRYDLPREQALRAVQRIWPDGRKRFTRGFEKPGTALRLGGPVVAGQVLLVCEGYATGLTLREATDRAVPVMVALDAGNLLPVCRLLAELYPSNPLVICADDDWRTRAPTGLHMNTGRIKAAEAAKAVGAAGLVWPIFAAATRQDGDTDFNDLHLRQGLGAVRRQLGLVLQLAGRGRRPAPGADGGDDDTHKGALRTAAA